MKYQAQLRARPRLNRQVGRNGLLAFALLALMACSPTVKVQAPDEPIEINLNIKIQQDIRIRLDKDVDELITDNPDIF